MGCDGGTIVEKREFIVKMRQGTKKIDKQTAAKLNWSICRLSKQVLDPNHMVACKVGFFYNKDAVMEHLLTLKLNRKSKTPAPIPKEFEHIKAISDVVSVKAEPNPDFNVAKDDPFDKVMFICPITRKEVHPQNRYFLMRTCGHLISEQALKLANEAMPSTQSCPVCSQESEITEINPSEEVEKEVRAALAKQVVPSKKSKKASKETKEETAASTTGEVAAAEAGDEDKKKKKKRKEHPEDSDKKKKSKKQRKEAATDAAVTPASSSHAIAPPPGATESVWRSMFLDKSKESQKKNNNDFLHRSHNDLVI